MKYAIATLVLLCTTIDPVFADDPQGSISGVIEWSKNDGQPVVGRGSRNPLVVTINNGRAICRKFQLFVTAGRAPVESGPFAPSSGARLGNQPEFSYQDNGDRHICTYQFTQLPEGSKLTLNLEAPSNWQYPANTPSNARISFIPLNNAQLVLQRDNIDAPAAAVVNFAGKLSIPPVIN
ncbi:hypothetical protein [Merismopedia glauca]|uniref:Uncharacterized protein n=1 Tax=Merismopedia glauca CCAP 1448/3 TaxID=1296344 RepID=A0A2T1C2F0_9CYAN|nr:hypothetical protein [Merismopedia glauca]PSB02441.1 hypothetical protein C7B64_13170 [Merismopedia glauca CCAP 1448/3]